MKLLTVLSVFQTACIIFLLATIPGERESSPTIASESAGAQHVPGRSAYSSEHDKDTSHVSGNMFVDDARLRVLIREELQRHAAALPDPVADVQPPQPRNTAEDQYRREFVELQIENYKSIGAISQQQMQDLQLEIARLDPVGRKEAVSKLMRAMNAGEIRGQL